MSTSVSNTAHGATQSLNRECINPRLEEHMIFICPECGKENDTQQEWRKHLNLKHNYASKTVEDFDFKEINDKYHECQICLKWVSNAHQAIALLQYHRFQHLPFPRTYRCKHCSSSFTRKTALCEHLLRYHNGLIKKVEKERKMQEVKKSFDDQSPKHNAEFYMKFLCPMCGKNINRFELWQQHIDTAHSTTSVDLRMFRIQSTKNYYCGQCCQTLCNGPTKAQLQRHHFTHLPYPLYFQCTFCTTKKCYKTEMLLHFIKSHKKEYEQYREYIKKPLEWAGPAQRKFIDELDQFMSRSGFQQTDILQKAIQESLLNLEDEIDKELSIKFNHEFALDQSLKELDDILNSEIDPYLQFKTVEKTTDQLEFEDEELEDLCNEIFEEVEDQCSKNNNISAEVFTQPNRKRLKLDLTATETGFKLNESQQREIQKYINYLCPECGNEFETQTLWRTHVFEQHNLANAVEIKFRPCNMQKTAYLCLVCYQVQRTSKHSDLRRHHFQHMPYQAYLKCTICTKTKSSKPKMLHHLQSIHLNDIQKNSIATNQPARTQVKNFRCIDCDKMYTHQTQYETHCRQCPQRLQPIAVGQYDIEKNMKLVEHLQKANKRISKLLEEEGVDVDSFKLPYK